MEAVFAWDGGAWSSLGDGLMLLAQAAVDAGGQAAGERAAGEPAAVGGLLQNMFFLPILIIGLLFYFLMLRPERKRAQDLKSMLDNLKQNDRIVTNGGVIGIVTNVQKDVVTVRIDDNTNAKMRILRSAVSRIVPDDAALGDDTPAK